MLISVPFILISPDFVFSSKLVYQCVSSCLLSLQYYKKVAATEWEMIWSFIPEVQLAILASCPENDYLVAMSKEVNLDYNLAKGYVKHKLQKLNHLAVYVGGSLEL
jgi:hypothetical protein